MHAVSIFSLSCTGSLSAEVQKLHAVAVSQGAVKELLACCNKALGPPLLPDLAVPAARALTAVLASDGARDEFAEQDGHIALTALLEALEGTSPCLTLLHAAAIYMRILTGSTSMPRGEQSPTCLSVPVAASHLKLRKRIRAEAM